MHQQAKLKTFYITAHDNHLYFLIFSLTETKEKFLPALSSHTGKPCLLLPDNCKACLYQRITWHFCHITPLFNLKISDWLSLVPEPGNIHWDGSHPTLRLRHAQPDGIRRQPLPKNAFAEIPVPFYLITSGCHASRHNPLLLKTYVFYLHGQQCYPLQAHLRTKWDSATPLSPYKHGRIKRRK